MALIQCPECGKTISDKASACPECGCPSQYYTKDNNNFENNEKKESDSEKKPEFINSEIIYEFSFGGLTTSIPESIKPFAKLYGEYALLAQKNVDEITGKFFTANGLDDVLHRIIPMGLELLNSAIDKMLNFLFQNGIIISLNEFWNKYSRYSLDYSFDYINSCQIVGDLYDNIIDEQNRLYKNEMAIRASRGRWHGGGFGIKGAIKGAMSASAMNAGDDFIHSFGDKAREASINRKIKSLMKEYQLNNKVYDVVCLGLGRCTINAFMMCIIELNNRVKLVSGNVCPNKAKDLFENAKRYKQKGDYDRYIIEIARCIFLSPAEERYYDEILPYAYKQNVHDLLNFMDFWNVGYIKTKYENDLLLGESFDKEFAKKYTNIDGLLDKYKVEDGSYKLENAYGEIRLFCMEVFKKYDLCFLPEYSVISDYFKDIYNKIDNVLLTNYEIIEWIPINICIEEFYAYIMLENIEPLKDKVFKNVWLIGDDRDKLKILTQYKVDTNNILMAIIYPGIDIRFRYCGVYFTDKEIVQFTGINKTVISYNAVEDVYYDKKLSIEIISGEDRILILNKQHNMNDYKCSYICNLIKIICVRYGNNRRLWNGNMKTPFPSYEKSIGLEHDNYIQNADSYYQLKNAFIKLKANDRMIFFEKYNKWFDEFAQISIEEISKYPMLTWIPESANNHSFIEMLRRDRLGAKPINYLWIKGDGESFRYKQPSVELYEYVYNELHDSSILMYSEDFYNEHIAGMMLTDNYIVDLYQYKAMHISNISTMYYDGGYIVIEGNQDKLYLYIKGYTLENISSTDQYYYYLYFINLLKLYSYRYGNNMNLYNDEMITINKDNC